MARNIINGMPTNEKLDGTNYDLWRLNIQFLLNNQNMVELLTTSKSVAAEKDEHCKDITASDQY